MAVDMVFWWFWYLFFYIAMKIGNYPVFLQSHRQNYVQGKNSILL